MSPLHRSLSTSAAAWSRLEPIIEEFEEAWLGDSQPDLNDFIPVDDPERTTLIIELVHSDLECRIKKGLQVQVETYIEKFPELAQTPPCLLELIETEFNLRRRREPGLSVAEFEQRFPQFREELAQRLSGSSSPDPSQRGAALDCPECGTPMNTGGVTSTGELTCPGCKRTIRVDPGHGPAARWPNMTRLGKFSLEAIVGKGAFGTVYRARDTELDRTVAVKVPRRPLTNAEEESRFLREARAAAQLTHPGIVPIYDVNRVEDCPYIVSGFVEGETLAETVKQRRLPWGRIAEVLADVAAAVEYAHQHKVIHRDLKPSNIMLGRLVGSGTGAAAGPVTPIVMDFGLARRDEGEIQMTLAGQILGTPAYMSPEQATGQGHQADARSDVYSLGVILYELLTGEVPFRGVPHLVLNQIRFEDPRPPCALNDKIPRDLETIALKCLEKEPARRYATAGTLAEELRRVVAGKPILARPLGKPERVWRWAKRNRAAAAALILFALLASTSTAAAALIQGQRQIAVAARGEAERLTEVANEERQFAVAARIEAERMAGIAKEQREKADLSATVANQQLNRSLDTQRLVFIDVVKMLEDRPGMAGLRQRLLRIAQEGLEEIVQLASRSAVQQNMAIVHGKVGDIYLQLGKVAEAQKEYEQAHQLARLAVAGERGADLELARQSYAVSCGRLGDVAFRRGQVKMALDYYREALAEAQQLSPATAIRPEVLRDAGLFHNRLGDVLQRSGKLADARESYLQSLDLAQQVAKNAGLGDAAHQDVALTHMKLGSVEKQLGNLKQARAQLDLSTAGFMTLSKEAPENVDTRRFLASAWSTLGQVYWQQHHFPGAWESHSRAVDDLEHSVRRDPHSIQSRIKLAESYQLLGEVQVKLGEVDAGLNSYQQALSRQQSLEREDPESTAPARILSITCERLGRINMRVGREKEARAFYQMARDRRERLAAIDPNDVNAQMDLAAVYVNLGHAEMSWHQFAAATKLYQEALAICARIQEGGKNQVQHSLLKQVPNWRGRLALAQAASRALEDLPFALSQPKATVPLLLAHRAKHLARKGLLPEAVDTIETLRRLDPKDGGNFYDVACLYAVCLTQLDNRAASGPLTEEEQAQRKDYRDRALAALAEARRLGYAELTDYALDADLAPLRSERAFQDVLQQLRRQVLEATVRR